MMMTRLPRSKDFWAGFTYMLIAALAFCFGTDLPLGTATYMGPGYFPMLIAGGLMLFGITVAAKGLVTGSEPLEPAALRPVLVLVAVALFALLVRSTGFVIASIVLTVVSSLSQPQIKPLRLAILSVALAAFGWAVFIWALELPLRTWPF